MVHLVDWIISRILGVLPFFLSIYCSPNTFLNFPFIPIRPTHDSTMHLLQRNHTTTFQLKSQQNTSVPPQERQFNNKTREILIQRGKQQTKGKGDLDLTRVKTKEGQGRSWSLWSPNSFLSTLNLHSQIWTSDAKSWSLLLRKGPNFNTNHLEILMVIEYGKGNVQSIYWLKQWVMTKLSGCQTVVYFLYIFVMNEFS